MRYLRAALLIVMLAYSAFAALAPERVYVHRFLLDGSFAQWVPMQIYPSMYSSEIFIHNEAKDSTYSVIHHPMRIFFEDKAASARCDSFTIEVRYRKYSEARRFKICGDSLIRLSRSQLEE